MQNNQDRMKNASIDYEKNITFQFDNRNLKAYQGDTLASALLANKIKLVARSFKYHRPRGIISAGVEEPNALLTINQGSYLEPNAVATTVELYQGLKAYSQNYFGSLRFDLMAVNDLLANFLSAGFYYKTFMWPKSFWEKIYEPAIRNAAGLGKLSELPDPARYEKAFLHCDLLVIGGGVAGLIAALTAGKSGMKVILAHEDFLFGGNTLVENVTIDKEYGAKWVKKIVEQLKSFDNIRLMKRTTVFGTYDHGIYGALERVADHLEPSKVKPRHVLWRIYAKRTLLATGASERHIAFHQNDRPGIMMANSVRTYAKRFGVKCGENITVFTNNDSGWHMARDLSQNNMKIKAIIDCRNIKPLYKIDDAEIHLGKNIVNTKGRTALKSITLNDNSVIKTDCLAVAGGWNPNVHLACHQRNRPVWQQNIASFVPNKKELPYGMVVAGAAQGNMQLSEIFADTHKKVSQIVEEAGLKIAKYKPPKIDGEGSYKITPYWFVEGAKKAFVDFQNDVTLKDIELSCLEGLHAPEHVKRYTTLGMAVDQGKTANIMALAVIGSQTGKTIEQTGTTLYRPPYTPISISSFAGRTKGKDYRPFRLPPSHKWAQEREAVFVEAGMWLRAQWFPVKGETHWRQSVDREVMAVRSSVGICDVSTLGKIDIKGKDAAQLLNFIYANGFAKLPVGKVRYGLMLREDGIVMDDGTTARLAENHFVMTTTTANAASVFRHMEFCRQCLRPDMDVHLQSITDYYAQYAIAGPNSRKLLQRIIDRRHDITNEAFPYMACGEFSIGDGIAVRLFRISFSGELAYEIALPARYGDSLIRNIMEIGADLNITPYGTEALGVMRIEKGHPAGSELNGQTSAHHLGMGKMLSGKKDFIGNILAQRKFLSNDDGVRLVGIVSVDKKQQLHSGAHFVAIGKTAETENDEGWISSVAYSPMLQSSIALGFVKDGANKMGEKIRAVSKLHSSDIIVQIVSPHMFDPKGERLRV